jgi:hypothetical protein
MSPNEERERRFESQEARKMKKNLSCPFLLSWFPN